MTETVAELITRDREIMSGTPVFAGTRVPVQTLFDYLEAGDSLDEFLDQYPTVARQQTVAVLALMRESMPANREATHDTG